MKYRHNHYVPVWYQKRFMRPDQHRYYRLDLKPEVVARDGGTYTRNDLHHWSPDRIFAVDDLYTTQWASLSNTEIEQFFFGRLDNEGPAAVDYFTNYVHPGADGEAFQTFMTYMSVQKLRTPKGLKYLQSLARHENKNLTLILLQKVKNMYCAIWTECVWQIADASDSATKFILSDHPVTVYNRACPPLSQQCRDYADPDIRLSATHTYFPLSLNKVLILTNLSWVRNPYQSEIRERPNPAMLRDSIFSFLTIQIGRKLSEDEVLQINLITKRRAYRYIAAAEQEWLYPERYVSTDYWKKFGNGYLLMPEPRLAHLGGEIFIGYKGGGSEAFSEYGHRPWQKGYKDKKREEKEGETLERFKAEWAMLRGAKFTAQDEHLGPIDGDSEDMTQHYREVAQRYRKRRRS